MYETFRKDPKKKKKGKVEPKHLCFLKLADISDLASGETADDAGKQMERKAPI